MSSSVLLRVLYRVRTRRESVREDRLSRCRSRRCLSRCLRFRRSRRVAFWSSESGFCSSSSRSIGSGGRVQANIRPAIISSRSSNNSSPLCSLQSFWATYLAAFRADVSVLALCAHIHPAHRNAAKKPNVYIHKARRMVIKRMCRPASESPR